MALRNDDFMAGHRQRAGYGKADDAGPNDDRLDIRRHGQMAPWCWKWLAARRIFVRPAVLS
jgi:hypothetical protein